MPRSIELICCGLVFWIYEEVGSPHHEKHVEVAFKRHRKAVFNIETGDPLIKHPNPKTYLTSDEVALAQRVIRRHRTKLLDDWERMQEGKGLSQVLRTSAK